MIRPLDSSGPGFSLYFIMCIAKGKTEVLVVLGELEEIVTIFIEHSVCV